MEHGAGTRERAVFRDSSLDRCATRRHPLSLASHAFCRVIAGDAAGPPPVSDELRQTLGAHFA